MKIKQALAILPPTRPTELLYTSTLKYFVNKINPITRITDLVAPVASIAVTRIISARAAILAPRITKASCVGSTLRGINGK